MSPTIAILLFILVATERYEAKFTPFGSDKCGGTYVDETEGTITSPGYPDESYPSETNCTYIVNAPPGYLVAYETTYMNLEENDAVSSLCVYDKLTIFDGGKQVDSVCGEKMLYLSATDSAEFKLEFISDFELEYEGFALKWYVFNPVDRDIAPKCNFDDALALCNGWKNTDEDDEYPWLFIRGVSPSPNTGPLTDHTSGDASGRYAYIEASQVARGSQATLESPTLITGSTSDKRCLRFWYHMFGGGTGTLKVTLNEGDSETELVKFEGDRGEAWQSAEVTFTLSASFATVSFHGIRGINYMSDIAIDDIDITVGSCNPDEDIPTDVGARGIPSSGNGFRFNNLIPSNCPAGLAKHSCPETCVLSCDIINQGLQTCPRWCAGDCACPEATPVLENNACVDRSICDSMPEVTTRRYDEVTTGSYNDNVTFTDYTNTSEPDPGYDKEREDIHDEIVSDLIRALMEYIKNTTN